MTWNLKKFRMQTFKDVDSEEERLAEASSKSIKRRHKREIERAERENRENTSALMELRDMEDELRTLMKLFETQAAALGRMLEIYEGEGLADMTHNGRGYLGEALERLAEYKTQTTEMLDRVAATRGDVSADIPFSVIPLFLSLLTLIPPHSTRSSSRWPSARRRWTTCAGPACRRSSRARRTSRS